MSPRHAHRISSADRRSMVLRRLPARQRLVRLRDRRVHDFLMDPGAGGQFDNIAVRITEIDRADKAVIDRSSDLAAFGLSLLQHIVEDIGLDPERDMQIQGVLLFEVEGLAGDLEEGEARPVVHLEKGVKPAPLVDLERADQAKPEEIFIEDPRLLRIAAAICIVMQTLDHVSLQADLPDLRIAPIAGWRTCRSRGAGGGSKALTGGNAPVKRSISTRLSWPVQPCARG